MTAQARFKAVDVERAAKGARKAGFTRVRVTIDPTGNIIMDLSDEAPLPMDRQNPLDRILKGPR